MSFVGKILIGVQLVLSLMFMAFAGAVATYHQNWKEAADKAESAKANIQQQLDQVRTEAELAKTALTKQYEDEKTRADEAAARADTVQQQNVALNRDKEQLALELQKEREFANITGTESGFRRQEALLQRSENKKLHDLLEQKEQKIRDLEGTVFSAQVELDALKDKNQSLIEQNAFFAKVIRTEGLSTDPREYAGSQTPPPAVDGLVLSVREARDGTVQFVEISIGSDDGLLQGHTLSVYRSGLLEGEKAKYLGQIEIVYLTPDRAVGTIVLAAKNGIIAKGDNVSSKL